MQQGNPEEPRSVDPDADEEWARAEAEHWDSHIRAKEKEAFQRGYNTAMVECQLRNINHELDVLDKQTGELLKRREQLMEALKDVEDLARAVSKDRT